MKQFVLQATFLLLSVFLISCGGKEQQQKKDTAATPKKTNSLSSNHNISKPNINFYIENSGSMLGYVNGVTEFAQILYNYLTDIEISEIANTLNLYYINEQIHKQPYNLKKYIGEVTPSAFASQSSKSGTSDISDIIQHVLELTNDSTLSIFVSDCIFSPGKGISADEYLINQQIEVKTNTANYLNNNDLSIIIYQFNSTFDGLYYNRIDKPTKIHSIRPFYVWIFGAPNQVATLQEKVPDQKFIGQGVQHKASLSTGTHKVHYSILPTSGNFRLDKKNPLHIVDAQKSTGNRSDKNKFTCIINADFSAYSLDAEYLKDIENYRLNNKDYDIALSESRQSGFTTSIKLTTEQLQPTTLQLDLLMKMPRWITDTNDDNGLNIMEEKAMEKTFGIKYLIGGLYDAFTLKSNIYTTLKVDLDTK